MYFQSPNSSVWFDTVMWAESRLRQLIFSGAGLICLGYAQESPKVYSRSPEPRKYWWFSCVYFAYTCAMVYGTYSYLLTGRDSGLMTYSRGQKKLTFRFRCTKTMQRGNRNETKPKRLNGYTIRHETKTEIRQ